MKLYFENSYGERKLIGKPKTSAKSWKMIFKYCKRRNYQIPYVRTWTTPEGERWYDVGSHTQFFVEVEDNGNKDVD